MDWLEAPGRGCHARFCRVGSAHHAQAIFSEKTFLRVRSRGSHGAHTLFLSIPRDLGIPWSRLSFVSSSQCP